MTFGVQSRARPVAERAARGGVRRGPAGPRDRAGAARRPPAGAGRLASRRLLLRGDLDGPARRDGRRLPHHAPDRGGSAHAAVSGGARRRARVSARPPPIESSTSSSVIVSFHDRTTGSRRGAPHSRGLRQRIAKNLRSARARCSGCARAPPHRRGGSLHRRGESPREACSFKASTVSSPIAWRIAGEARRSRCPRTYRAAPPRARNACASDRGARSGRSSSGAYGTGHAHCFGDSHASQAAPVS